MQFIDPSNTLINWSTWGDYHIPTSVPTTCGYCERHTAINLAIHNFDPKSNTLNFTGGCVICGKKHRAWILEPKKIKEVTDQEKKCEEIWVHPKAEGVRELVVSQKQLPLRIFNAYKEAVNCFNAGFYRACVTECGRTLEGIIKDKFPNDEKRNTLNKVLEGTEKDLKTHDHSDLFKPIIKVGHALRLGRNKSAHFDPEVDPDKETAEEILNLAEYLVEYFYVLTNKANSLEEKMKKLVDLEEA